MNLDDETIIKFLRLNTSDQNFILNIYEQIKELSEIRSHVEFIEELE